MRGHAGILPEQRSSERLRGISKKNHYGFHVTCNKGSGWWSLQDALHWKERKSSSWICDQYMKSIMAHSPFEIYCDLSNNIQITFLHDHAFCEWKIRNRCGWKNPILVFTKLYCADMARRKFSASIFYTFFYTNLLYKYTFLLYKYRDLIRQFYTKKKNLLKNIKCILFN